MFDDARDSFATGSRGRQVHSHRVLLLPKIDGSQWPSSKPGFARAAKPRTALDTPARAKIQGLSDLVCRVDTGNALMFLADPNAYKVQPAVKFPFMDCRRSTRVEPLGERGWTARDAPGNLGVTTNLA
jgi:hypothetical protein